MRNRSWCLAALVLGLATTSLHAQVPVHKHYQHTDSFDTASPSGARAPRLQKVGKHAFPVTTKSEQAQLFMNQGLNLAYGFNHAEAGARSPKRPASIRISRWRTGAWRSCSARTSTRRWRPRKSRRRSSI